MELFAPLASYKVTSPFGTRTHPVTGEANTFHSGVDLAAPEGTPVLAAAPGTVGAIYTVGTPKGEINGNTVFVDHAGGYRTAYLHLSQIGVTVGQQVVTGQRLGAVGHTGRATGPHLHFMLYQNGTPVDPLRFLVGQAVETALSVPRTVFVTYGRWTWGALGLLTVGALVWMLRRRRAPQAAA